jgi:hypothetical protein
MTSLGIFDEKRCRQVELDGKPILTTLPVDYQTWSNQQLLDASRESGISDLPAVAGAAARQGLGREETRDWRIVQGNLALLSQELNKRGPRAA